MLPGFPQLSLAPQTCPSLPRAVSTSQCLLMSSQCSSLLDSSSLETCYLLWKLVIFSGVLWSSLESCCLFWSLLFFPGVVVFSGVSLSSLGPHCPPWSLIFFPGVCHCQSSSVFAVVLLPQSSLSSESMCFNICLPLCSTCNLDLCCLVALLLLPTASCHSSQGHQALSVLYLVKLARGPT